MVKHTLGKPVNSLSKHCCYDLTLLMQRTKTHLFTKADLHHSYGLLMAQLICMSDSFYTIYVGVRPLEHIPIIIQFQFEKFLTHVTFLIPWNVVLRLYNR